MKLFEFGHHIRCENATADLIIPVDVIAMSDSDLSKSNFANNIKLLVPWVDSIPAHNRVALVCGSGPSIVDDFNEIKQRVNLGGDEIFAVNGTSLALAARGITVYSQVILDADPVGKLLFCPQVEYHHLSPLVDPALFKMATNPVLWQPDLTWIPPLLKDEPRNFTYICGSWSVSLYAICLVYTLGYREIHCYGLDSSNEGHLHHLEGIGRDEIDYGVSHVTVDFDGKRYETAFDMKAQAEKILLLRPLLERGGCSLYVHGRGLLPEAFKVLPTDPSLIDQYLKPTKTDS